MFFTLHVTLVFAEVMIKVKHFKQASNKNVLPYISLYTRHVY